MAMNIFESSVVAFSECSQRLLARYTYDAKVHKGLQKFITGCQYACTANLNWRSVRVVSIQPPIPKYASTELTTLLSQPNSLESSRYKLGYISLSGNVRMTL